MNSGCVYIMSNKNRTTLYIGVTSNLTSRVLEHRSGKGSKFTAKYNCSDLIYFEYHPSIVAAIAREKQLKNWHREWKMNLIKSENPELLDLSQSVGVGGWIDTDQLIRNKVLQFVERYWDKLSMTVWKSLAQNRHPASKLRGGFRVCPLKSSFFHQLEGVRLCQRLEQSLGCTKWWIGLWPLTNIHNALDSWTLQPSVSEHYCSSQHIKIK